MEPQRDGADAGLQHTIVVSQAGMACAMTLCWCRRAWLWHSKLLIAQSSTAHGPRERAIGLL